MNALEDFGTTANVLEIYPAFAQVQTPETGQQPLAAASPKPQKLLDRASAAELRQHLAADFAAAEDWFSLCRCLRRKGLCLKRREDDIWVFDAASLAAVSSCADLGIDTDELELGLCPPQPQRPFASAA
ncbi:MAG: hypothetical protein AB3N24_12925 [Leisingera sp.]